MSLYQNVLAQFEKAANLMNLDPVTRLVLSSPQREHTFYCPVRMDSGEVRMFTGYRVQHSDLLGPFKGGLRFHPKVDLDEVRALAAWMTLKSAIADIPLGGGKGGISVDVTKLSQGELERLSRRFAKELFDVVGPEVDIPAPDVNTNPQIMAWMVDTMQTLAKPSERQQWLATLTGKPVEVGGSLGRTEATGFGVIYTVEEALKRLGLDPKACTAAIQGFGNVAQYAAIGFIKLLGGVVTCVSCWDHKDAKGYTYSHKNGVDPLFLQSITNTYGTIDAAKAREAGYAQEEAMAWIEKDVDVLIPAAMENMITAETAPRIHKHVKIVAEGANGPTTPEGDAILAQKGIHLIPDVQCNSGGVTVSYFEWVQNREHEQWSVETVNAKLRAIITKGYRRVAENAEKYGTDARTAAYITALARLAPALKFRGIWP